VKDVCAKIKETIRRHKIEASFVDLNVAEILIEKIALVFDLDRNRSLIWETVKGQMELKEYGENSEVWEKQLMECLLSFRGEVFLVITNEEFYPWPILRCRKEDLAVIIADQFFFEYFIFDAEMHKIVFDTHHNTLLCYSALS